jgi:hypothetical protein
VSGQSGVYRAGPLTLAVGEDLSQQVAAAGGSEAIAIVTGARPVMVSVESGAAATVSLQFGTPLTPEAGSGGDARVRFPACGGGLRRFGGGILYARRGCARLRIQPAGMAATEMLIPIGPSLRGCPAPGHAAALPVAALPFLGVACGRPDWIGCSRLGVGASVSGRAALVVARVAGTLVTLSPPDTPAGTGWLGYLQSADYRHGPLEVRVRRGATHWYGSPEVWPRAQVIAFDGDGRTATVSGWVLMHPGFG